MKEHLPGTMKSDFYWQVGENWEVKQGIAGLGVQFVDRLENLQKEFKLYRL